MRFLGIFLGLVSIFLGFIFTLPAEQPAIDCEHIVRVAVIKQASRIKLTIRSSFKLVDLNDNKELYQGRGIWYADILPGEQGLKIGRLDFKSERIRIQPKKSPAIYLNGRKFRGTVDIIRQSAGEILAVNHLDVEEYVRGVLSHEIAPWWPMEAIKAQAIVSRTFALYQASVNSDKDYDLFSTVYSQVYGGRTSERGRTSKAVRLTENKVLTYKDKLFPTFYHATCAGHTERASQLWKIDLPPLRGRECQFCRRSPHFHWKKKLSLERISRALEKAGYKIGRISSIVIEEKNVSGRVTELKISSPGEDLRLNANRFRLAVGPNLIRSPNFSLVIQGQEAEFTGLGWGHGVGMCQWGSFFMARKRFNAEQILDYYYPGSRVKSLSGLIDRQGNYATF